MITAIRTRVRVSRFIPCLTRSPLLGPIGPSALVPRRNHPLSEEVFDIRYVFLYVKDESCTVPEVCRRRKHVARDGSRWVGIVPHTHRGNFSDGPRSMGIRGIPRDKGRRYRAVIAVFLARAQHVVRVDKLLGPQRRILRRISRKYPE